MSGTVSGQCAKWDHIPVNVPFFLVFFALGDLPALISSTPRLGLSRAVERSPLWCRAGRTIWMDMRGYLRRRQQRVRWRRKLHASEPKVELACYAIFKCCHTLPTGILPPAVFNGWQIENGAVGCNRTFQIGVCRPRRYTLQHYNLQRSRDHTNDKANSIVGQLPTLDSVRAKPKTPVQTEKDVSLGTRDPANAHPYTFRPAYPVVNINKTSAILPDASKACLFMSRPPSLRACMGSTQAVFPSKVMASPLPAFQLRCSSGFRTVFLELHAAVRSCTVVISPYTTAAI